MNKYDINHKSDMEAIRLANSNKINEEKIRRQIESMNRNSLLSEGAEEYTFTEKKDRASKKFFKYLITILIIISLLIPVFNKINDDIKLRDANNFMSSIMTNYLDESSVDYIISSGDIEIIENDLEKLRSLCESLEKAGFTHHEALYAISATCGSDGFNKAVQAFGYKDYNNFLYNNYRSIDTYQGDYHIFENNVQVGYVENASILEKMLEEGKGKNI